jgi:tripartite motif-containing protein 71
MENAVYRYSTAVLIAFASLTGVLPCVAWAQPPTYITQWGSQGSGDGQFLYPVGIAVDASGNVYVADSNNNRIEKFTSSGAFITKWGVRGAGNGQFYIPTGVAVGDSGNVYVADSYNMRIQKFTSSGTYLSQWGKVGNSGSSGDGEFSLATGVATDKNGNVYVADRYNYRIQVFTGSGAFIRKWGSYGDGNGQFNDPFGVAVDANGNVYVADQEYNHRIQVFTNSGTYLTQWGTPGTGNGQFNEANSPTGVAVDGAGRVYVADFANNRIQVFSGAGAYLTQWGTLGTGSGEFQNPYSVAVDGGGNVYVTDGYNHRIQVFGELPTPAATATWGQVKATYRK